MPVTGGADRVLAMLRMSADEVPVTLRARLQAAVTPVWSPTGTAKPVGHDAVELLVTAGEVIGAEQLDRLPGLRAIVLTSTAADGIDLRECRDRDILVCNNPRYTGPAVAEHALALAFAVNRRLSEQDAGARADPPQPPPLSRDMAGSVAGIVGLGDIGGRLATLAQALGMRVIFTNRSRRDFPGAAQVSLAELVEQADFVFLTLPLTQDSSPLLDSAAFGRMRPGTFVINVSADELIDRAALAVALRSEQIAGAALDVIGSPKPYLGLPRLLLTPASAWYTREGVVRRVEGWLTTVEAYVAGQPRHVLG